MQSDVASEAGESGLLPVPLQSAEEPEDKDYWEKRESIMARIVHKVEAGKPAAEFDLEEWVAMLALAQEDITTEIDEQPSLESSLDPDLRIELSRANDILAMAIFDFEDSDQDITQRSVLQEASQVYRSTLDSLLAKHYNFTEQIYRLYVPSRTEVSGGKTAHKTASADNVFLRSARSHAQIASSVYYWHIEGAAACACLAVNIAQSVTDQTSGSMGVSGAWVDDLDHTIDDMFRMYEDKALERATNDPAQRDKLLERMTVLSRQYKKNAVSWGASERRASECLVMFDNLLEKMDQDLVPLEFGDTTSTVGTISEAPTGAW